MHLRRAFGTRVAKCMLFCFVLGCVSLWAVLQYGYWQARQLEGSRIELPAGTLKGAGALRIAFFADTHDDRALTLRLVEQIEQAKPDLIIFGGDLLTAGPRFSRTREVIALYRRLSQTAPTYAIYGNHDMERMDEVARVFREAGVKLLRNEGVTFENRLRIVGLGSWNEGDLKPQLCLEEQSELPVLLLSHDPDSREALGAYDWDLMLAGHTHGTQASNPFTGKALALRTDMPAGLYEWEGGRQIFVTRGVGSFHGLRFFSCPEWCLIELP